MEGLVGVALQDLIEHRPVEGVVPRLVLGDVPQHFRQPGLVFPDDPSGLGVRELGRPLLDRGVHEDPVGVPVPLRMEPGAQVLELHFFDFALVEQAGIPAVVVEDGAVSVLFRGPEIVPEPPVTRVAKVYREQPVEVGQPLFRQRVECDGSPDRVGDSLGLGPQSAYELIGARVRLGREQLGRIPQLPFALVRLHELSDAVLHVPEDLHFGSEIPLCIGDNGGAHAVPSRDVVPDKTRRTSLLR